MGTHWQETEPITILSVLLVGIAVSGCTLSSPSPTQTCKTHIYIDGKVVVGGNGQPLELIEHPEATNSTYAELLALWCYHVIHSYRGVSHFVTVAAIAALLSVATFSAIASHGSVSAAEPNTWVTEIVASDGDVGRYTSLAFDPWDCPSIAYQSITYTNATNYALKYAHCDGSAWNIQTVDNNYAGFWCSIAYDPSGNPAISYCSYLYYFGDDRVYSCAGGKLKFASYNGTGWAIQTIDSSDGAGEYTCLTFDQLGNPGISYFQMGDLKYAYFDGTSWQIKMVEESVNVGQFTSLAFDTSGYPCISYYGEWRLNYARFDGNNWLIEIVDDGWQEGCWNSLTFDLLGRPSISYTDNVQGELKYAHWDGTRWSTQTLDGGRFTSLAFDLQGNPCISYYGNKLKYAHFNGISWDIETIDSSSNEVGQYSCLAFDSKGNPGISYYARYSGDLKYAFNPGLLANFTADTATRIVEGQSVQFTDMSLGEIDSWQWNFGDGTSVVEWNGDTKPPEGKLSHIYTTKGNYTVSLRVSSSRGIHTETKSNYISVYVPGDVEIWAIIVGVSDYKNFGPASGLPLPWENYDLSYPADEAVHFYNKLSPIVGQSHIHLLTDSGASKDSIKSAVLDWLSPKEGPEDIVLVFFSGHGNSGYLCPYDSLETSYTNDISGSLLDSWLDTLDSERVVIILDSCESGGYAASLAGQGRVVLAASEANESAWGFSDLESSVFSYYLLDGLEHMSLVDADGDARISAEELFHYAEPKVVSYSAEYADVQHPQLFDSFVGELDLFSLLTITFNVSDSSVSLTIDGTEMSSTGTAVSCTWVVGTNHTISIPTEVQDGDGTRYVFSYWSDGNTSASRTLTASEATTLAANYTRQYYLTVESQYGTTQGEGWYDEGTEAEFSVSGGSSWHHTFGGWRSDVGTNNQSARIIMNGPKTVTAVWKPSACLWAAVAGGAVLLVALLVLTLHWHKRAAAIHRIRKSELTPPESGAK